MSKQIFQLLKVVLSIGLAIVLLFFVFKNVSWAAFWNQAKSVDYTWVVLSILLSIVAYMARAYRWNILLEPLGYQLRTQRTTLAVLIGYLANLALPRLGEITRCGVLNRNDQVPMSVGLGSVVTERLVDFLTLLLLIAISLIIESDRLIGFLTKAYSDLHIPVYVLFILVGLGLAGAVGMYIIYRISLKSEGKIATLIQGFISGILSLKNIQRPVGFLVSTLVLWVVYYLMSYIIIFSLPETSHLGIGVGFMLLVTGGIALSLPVQSGFGTYHGMISGMLLLYGVNEASGLFLATLLHTSQIVAVAIFGSVALVISAFIRKKAKRSQTI